MSLGVGKRSVDIDISVNEVIRDKNARISKALVEGKGSFDACLSTSADGCGVQMRFVTEHSCFLLSLDIGW